MEKFLLNTKQDLRNAIQYFGNKYNADIVNTVNKYPCILIGYYSEDIEFGSGYTFATITKDDFNNDNGVRYF